MADPWTQSLIITIPKKGQPTALPEAGPLSAVGRVTDSSVRGPGIDIRFGHILSFLLLLIQEEQLEKVCARSTGLPLSSSKPARERCGQVN